MELWGNPPDHLRHSGHLDLNPRAQEAEAGGSQVSMPAQLMLHASLCLTVKRRVENEERVRGAAYCSPKGTGNAFGWDRKEKEQRKEWQAGTYWDAGSRHHPATALLGSRERIKCSRLGSSTSSHGGGKGYVPLVLPEDL